jgi:hypothetical protein
VFFQAALTVNDQNALAATELADLLADVGQVHEARQLLLLSVSAQPTAQAWTKLAAVHRRLGEAELASLADQEAQLLAPQGHGTHSLDGLAARLSPAAPTAVDSSPPATGNPSDNAVPQGQIATPENPRHTIESPASPASEQRRAPSKGWAWFWHSKPRS